MVMKAEQQEPGPPRPVPSGGIGTYPLLILFAVFYFHERKMYQGAEVPAKCFI